MNESAESSTLDKSTLALPEKIDTSSGSRTNSDVEGMSGESGSVLNLYGDQGEDVDISFASSCDPASPEPSQQGIFQPS